MGVVCALSGFGPLCRFRRCNFRNLCSSLVFHALRESFPSIAMIDPSRCNVLYLHTVDYPANHLPFSTEPHSLSPHARQVLVQLSTHEALKSPSVSLRAEMLRFHSWGRLSFPKAVFAFTSRKVTSLMPPSLSDCF